MKKLLTLSLLANILAVILFLFLLHSLGGWKYVLFKMQHRGVAGVYEHKKSLYEILPDDENEIVFLGNSITAAGNWAELFQNPQIKNRGIDGDMTQGILERLEEVVRAKPLKVFLMIGVNDLISHSPAYVVDNYRKILATIQARSPETAVYVQSILPVNDDVRRSGIKNKHIEIINKKIESLAQEFKYKYVDLHIHFRDKTGKLNSEYTSDGIHLNGKAYLKWKKLIQEYVTN